MIELNDEKVLKIIFSACFILVDFSGCHIYLSDISRHAKLFGWWFILQKKQLKVISYFQ